MKNKKTQELQIVLPDIELKLLGNLFGCPLYIDLAKAHNDKKFLTYAKVNTALRDLFTPPKETL